MECDQLHSFLFECFQDGRLGHNTFYFLSMSWKRAKETRANRQFLCFILSVLLMELGELIEELEVIEKSIGSDSVVFVKTGVDEVELYWIEIRQIDERSYEVVVKWWL